MGLSLRKKGMRLALVGLVGSCGAVACFFLYGNSIENRIIREGESCAQNMRLIEAACCEVYVDQKHKAGDVIERGQVLSMLGTNDMLRCPAGSQYVMSERYMVDGTMIWIKCPLHGDHTQLSDVWDEHRSHWIRSAFVAGWSGLRSLLPAR